jgi:hypothetical protein
MPDDVLSVRIVAELDNYTSQIRAAKDEIKGLEAEVRSLQGFLKDAAPGNTSFTGLTAELDRVNERLVVTKANLAQLQALKAGGDAGAGLEKMAQAATWTSQSVREAIGASSGLDSVLKSAAASAAVFGTTAGAAATSIAEGIESQNVAIRRTAIATAEAIANVTGLGAVTKSAESSAAVFAQVMGVQAANAKALRTAMADAGAATMVSQVATRDAIAAATGLDHEVKSAADSAVVFSGALGIGAERARALRTAMGELEEGSKTTGAGFTGANLELKHFIGGLDELSRHQTGAFFATLGAAARDSGLLAKGLQAITLDGIVAASQIGIIGAALAVFAYDAYQAGQTVRDSVGSIALLGQATPATNRQVEGEQHGLIHDYGEGFSSSRAIITAFNEIDASATHLRPQLIQLTEALAAFLNISTKDAAKELAKAFESSEGAIKFAAHIQAISPVLAQHLHDIAAAGSEEQAFDQVLAALSERFGVAGAAAAKFDAQMLRLYGTTKDAWDPVSLLVRGAIELAAAFSQVKAPDLAKVSAALPPEQKAGEIAEVKLTPEEDRRATLQEQINNLKRAEVSITHDIAAADAKTAAGQAKLLVDLYDLSRNREAQANAAVAAAHIVGAADEQEHQRRMAQLAGEMQQAQSDAQRRVAIAQQEYEETRAFVTGKLAPVVGAMPAYKQAGDDPTVIASANAVAEAKRHLAIETAQIQIDNERASVAEAERGADARVEAERRVVAIWQQMQAQGLASAREVATAQVQLASVIRQVNDQQFRDYEANSRQQVEQARGDVAKIKAIYADLANAAQNRFHQNPSVVTAIDTEGIKAQQQAQQKLLSDEENVASGYAHINQMRLDQAKAALDQEVAQHKLSKVQELQAEQNLTAQMAAEQEKRLEKILATDAATLDDKIKINTQIAELEAQTAAKLEEDQAKITEAVEAENKKQVAAFTEAFDQIGSAFDSSIKGLIDGSIHASTTLTEVPHQLANGYIAYTQTMVQQTALQAAALKVLQAAESATIDAVLKVGSQALAGWLAPMVGQSFAPGETPSMSGLLGKMVGGLFGLGTQHVTDTSVQTAIGKLNVDVNSRLDKLAQLLAEKQQAIETPAPAAGAAAPMAPAGYGTGLSAPGLNISPQAASEIAASPYSPQEKALAAALMGGEAHDFNQIVGGKQTFDLNGPQPNIEGLPGSHAFGGFQFQPGTYDAASQLAGISSNNVTAQGQISAEVEWARKIFSQNTGGQNLDAALAGGNLAQVKQALAGEWPGGTNAGFQSRYDQALHQFSGGAAGGQPIPVSIDKVSGGDLPSTASGAVPVEPATPPTQTTTVPPAPAPAPSPYAASPPGMESGLLAPGAGTSGSDIPQLLSGGHVDSAGLALLHAGETVVPGGAATASAISAGGGGAAAAADPANTAATTVNTGALQSLTTSFGEYLSRSWEGIKEGGAAVGGAFTGTAQNYLGQENQLLAGNMSAGDLAGFVTQHIAGAAPGGSLSSGIRLGGPYELGGYSIPGSTPIAPFEHMGPAPDQALQDVRQQLIEQLGNRPTPDAGAANKPVSVDIQQVRGITVPTTAQGGLPVAPPTPPASLSDRYGGLAAGGAAAGSAGLAGYALLQSGAPVATGPPPDLSVGGAIDAALAQTKAASFAAAPAGFESGLPAEAGSQLTTAIAQLPTQLADSLKASGTEIGGAIGTAVKAANQDLVSGLGTDAAAVREGMNAATSLSDNLASTRSSLDFDRSSLDQDVSSVGTNTAAVTANTAKLGDVSSSLGTAAAAAPTAAPTAAAAAAKDPTTQAIADTSPVVSEAQQIGGLFPNSPIEAAITGVSKLFGVIAGLPKALAGLSDLSGIGGSTASVATTANNLATTGNTAATLTNSAALETNSAASGGLLSGLGSLLMSPFKLLGDLISPITSLFGLGSSSSGGLFSGLGKMFGFGGTDEAPLTPGVNGAFQGGDVGSVLDSMGVAAAPAAAKEAASSTSSGGLFSGLFGGDSKANPDLLIGPTYEQAQAQGLFNQPNLSLAQLDAARGPDLPGTPLLGSNKPGYFSPEAATNQFGYDPGAGLSTGSSGLTQLDSAAQKASSSLGSTASSAAQSGSALATTGTAATTAGAGMTTAGAGATTAGAGMTTAGAGATTAGAGMTTAGTAATTAGAEFATAGTTASAGGVAGTVAGIKPGSLSYPGLYDDKSMMAELFPTTHGQLPPIGYGMPGMTPPGTQMTGLLPGSPEAMTAWEHNYAYGLSSQVQSGQMTLGGVNTDLTRISGGAVGPIPGLAGSSATGPAALQQLGSSAQKAATDLGSTASSAAQSGTALSTTGTAATTAGTGMTTAGVGGTTAGTGMTTAGVGATTAGAGMTTAGTSAVTAGAEFQTAGTTAAAGGATSALGGAGGLGGLGGAAGGGGIFGMLGNLIMMPFKLLGSVLQMPGQLLGGIFGGGSGGSSGGLFGGLFGGAAGGAAGGGGGIFGMLGSLIQMPFKLLGSALQLPGQLLGGISGGIGGGAAAAGGAVAGGAGAAAASSAPVVAAVTAGTASNVAGHAANVAATGADTAATTVGAASNVAVTTGGTAANEASTLAQTAATTASQTTSSTLIVAAIDIQTITPKPFGFDTGAWEIPGDMPAIIHKGEMIIPAAQAGYLRTALQGAPTARGSARAMSPTDALFSMKAQSNSSAPVGMREGLASISALFSNIPKLDVGAWDISHDLVANIHKGEAVVPAAFAGEARARGFGLGGNTTNNQAGGDSQVHLNFAPTINAPEAMGLNALLTREGDTMKAWLQNAYRNGSLKLRS